MMIILKDDRVIEIFESPENPPDWIEGIDIENHEYQFCSDSGQIYIGHIVKPSGIFSEAIWRLKPEGKPDMKNLDSLINEAEMIEPNDKFADLEELKKFTQPVK